MRGLVVVGVFGLGLAFPACFGGVRDPDAAEGPTLDAETPGRGPASAGTVGAGSDDGGSATPDVADAAEPSYACSPLAGDASTPSTVGGTRLRPVAWTSPDGLDVPGGIRDTLAGVDCSAHDLYASYHTATYCRPTPTPYATHVYLDATCTTMGLVGPAGLAGSVITTEDAEDVDLTWVGTEVTPMHDVWLQPPGGACHDVGGSSPVRYAPVWTTAEAAAIATHLYVVSSRAPLVEMSGLSRRCVNSFVDALFLSGKDGSQLFTGALADKAHFGDTRPALDLSLSVASDDQGAARWLPHAPRYICQTGGLTYVSESDPYELLFEGKVHGLLSGSTKACDVWGPQGQLSYASFLGAVIPSATFAPASVVAVGGSRIQANVRTAGPTPIFAPSGNDVVDVTLGQHCAPERASDGNVRCLPPDVELRHAPVAGAFVAYADASCTTPIALAELGAPAPAMVRDVRSRVGSCSSKVYGVGAQIPTPSDVYGHWTDGAAWGAAWDCSGCSRLNSASAQGGFDVANLRAFAITGEVPPSQLAPMSVVTR